MSVETYWLVAPLTFMALSMPIWLYVWLVPVPPPARAAAPGHQAARGNATMSDLYDADFRRWTERQSGLLRRMGAGDRVNDQVDWNHVAEEIESLGKSDRRQVINRMATIDGFLPIFAFRIPFQNRVQRQLEYGRVSVLGVFPLTVRF